MSSPHDPYAPKDPAVFESTSVERNAAVAPTPSAEPPKGTSAEVLGWVDGDKTRAQAALDHENSTNKPRKGLVDELKEIIEE